MAWAKILKGARRVHFLSHIPGSKDTGARNNFQFSHRPRSADTIELEPIFVCLIFHIKCQSFFFSSLRSENLTNKKLDTNSSVIGIICFAWERAMNVCGALPLAIRAYSPQFNVSVLDVPSQAMMLPFSRAALNL